MTNRTIQSGKESSDLSYPKGKWIILNKQSATKYGISIIDITKDTNILSLPIEHIPKNKRPEQFLKYLIKVGVLKYEVDYEK